MDKETKFDFDNTLTDSGSFEDYFGGSNASADRNDPQGFFPPPEDGEDPFAAVDDDWLHWDNPARQTEVDSLVSHTPTNEAVSDAVPPQRAAQDSLPDAVTDAVPVPEAEAEKPLPVEAEQETDWEDDFAEDTAENSFDDSPALSDDWSDDWNAAPSRNNGRMPFDGAPLWEASDAPKQPRPQKTSAGANKGKGISPAAARIIVPFAAFVIVMTVVCAVLFISKGGWKKESNNASVSFSDKAYTLPEQGDTPSTTEPTTPEETTQESTAATTAATAYRALAPEEKSKDVLKMQKRLLELGYIGEESCTGFYGSYTKKRLAVFQKKAGLEPTGIADAATLERLYAPDAPKCV